MNPFEYLKALNRGVIDSEVGQGDDYEEDGITPDSQVALNEPAPIPEDNTTLQPIPPENDKVAAYNTQIIPQELLSKETPSDKVLGESTRLNDLLSRYKDAQLSRQSSAQTAQLMRSADMIATGLAGQGAKRAPDEMFSGIEKLGALPLQNIQEEITARPAIQKTYLSERMGDKDSDISNLARLAVKSRYGTVEGIDNMSAADLEALGFKIGTLKDPNAQSTVKEWQMVPGGLEINGMPQLSRFSTLGKPPEIWDGNIKDWVVAPSSAKFVKPDTKKNDITGGYIQITPTGGVKELATPGVTPTPLEQPTVQRSSHDIYNTLNSVQRKYLTDKIEPVMNKELSDFQAQREAANRIRQSLAVGKYQGDMPRAVQNAFAHLNGEKGMMSEADVAGYKGRQDIISKLKTFANLAVNSKFSDSDRQFLNAFANEYEKESSEFMTNRAKKHVANAARNTGLNDKDSAVLLNLDAYMGGLSDTASGDTNNKVKIRRKSDGKILTFTEEKAKEILKDPKFEKVKQNG